MNDDEVSVIHGVVSELDDEVSEVDGVVSVIHGEVSEPDGVRGATGALLGETLDALR